MKNVHSPENILCGMQLMHTLPLKHLDLDLHLIASRCLAHGPTKEFKQQRSDWIKSYSLKASDGLYDTATPEAGVGALKLVHGQDALYPYVQWSNVLGPQLWIKRINESPHFQ